jgi:hypothetical protein
MVEDAFHAIYEKLTIDDAKSVYKIFNLFENMLDARPDVVANRIFARKILLRIILKHITRAKEEIT